MPTFKLDEQVIEYQPGDTIIQAAHRAGVDIPHYCWHPGLSVAANCRMCLVEIMPPPGRPSIQLDVLRFDEAKGDYVKAKKPKLQPACQQGVSENMEVKSQSSEHVREARSAVQEFLLLNHPVDCPICDQAGECRLQDYWLEHSGKKKRMKDEIVHKPKAVDFGPTIVYDAERCIVCTRCVRFCEEVVKDPVLDKRERGNLGEIVLAPGRQLDHDYTLMTEYVCPVGALTAKDFRFKARVWFLRSVRSVCQGCASGCNSFTDYDPRNQTVYRHRPRENMAINKYWMCDAGMLDYRRIHENRVLDARVGGRKASVDDALSAAAKALSQASPEQSALLLSALHSNEDNFALYELAKQLGITRVYLAGKPAGKGDDILRSADKNPNRAGVLALLGDQKPGDLAALAADIDGGKVTTVLAVGSDIEDPARATSLSKAKVVALVTHEGPVAQLGHVVLPASSWAEAEGTFVNEKGISQVSEKAIAPQGNSLPAWTWVIRLGEALGKALPFKKAKEVKAASSQISAGASA
ncbi:MAG TPA: 2Fe-2S iron-sulfur cluster-binding protein [Polyangiaceae bacterium]|nr:2Fe-2S iron-sulfur cluster-binding protein [Polyangiaceae bacterium]